MTYLQAKTNKKIALQCGEWILSGRHLELVWTDTKIWDKAWTLFQTHQDKEWAFTDCVSFIVMREHNLWEAFSFDNRFVQAGFSLWPK